MEGEMKRIIQNERMCAERKSKKWRQKESYRKEREKEIRIVYYLLPFHTKKGKR
jgi:hypothetical protein